MQESTFGLSQSIPLDENGGSFSNFDSAIADPPLCIGLCGDCDFNADALAILSSSIQGSATPSQISISMDVSGNLSVAASTNFTYPEGTFPLCRAQASASARGGENFIEFPFLVPGPNPVCADITFEAVTSSDFTPEGAFVSETFSTRVIFDDLILDTSTSDSFSTSRHLDANTAHLVRVEFLSARGTSVVLSGTEVPKGNECLGAPVIASVAGSYYDSVTVTIEFTELTDGCPEDINGDGSVTVSDVIAVLSAFGDPACDINITGSCCCCEDVNMDGQVSTSDVTQVIAAFGECPG